MSTLVKKLLSSFILSIIMLLPISSSYAWETYLWGDTNYVQMETKQGTNYYLDLSSAYVKEYNPPIYKIAGNLLVVRNNNVIRTIPMEFKYDISKENNWKMYYLSSSSNSYKYIKPQYVISQNGVILPVGESLFYYVYKMPFYGNQHPSQTFSRLYSEL